jgi:hypothetical protein
MLRHIGKIALRDHAFLEVRDILNSESGGWTSFGNCIDLSQLARRSPRCVGLGVRGSAVPLLRFSRGTIEQLAAQVKGQADAPDDQETLEIQIRMFHSVLRHGIPSQLQVPRRYVCINPMSLIHGIRVGDRWCGNSRQDLQSTKRRVDMRQIERFS